MRHGDIGPRRRQLSHTRTLTRRSVADVQGTLLLAVAVLPLKHTAPAGVSHVSSETFAHLPTLPPIAQHVVPQCLP